MEVLFFPPPGADYLRLPSDKHMTVDEVAALLFGKRPKYVGGIEAFYTAMRRAVQTGKMKLLGGSSAVSEEAFRRSYIDHSDMLMFIHRMEFGMWIAPSAKASATTSTKVDVMKSHPPAPTSAHEHFASFDLTAPRYADKALNNEYTVAWWDLELKASMWWQIGNVKPQEAAMLLCGLHPQKDSTARRTLEAVGEPNTEDYQLMLRWFEDASQDGQPRSLGAWLDFAKGRGLKIHSWISAWLTAGGGSTRTPSTADSTHDRTGVVSTSTNVANANGELGADTPAARSPSGPRPEPLTTGDIAFCFDTLKWTEAQWKKPLGDKPKWLVQCIALPGQRGVRETRWNPVLIGGALVRLKHARANSVRARFQTQPLLQPWLETWKTFEADNFDS